MESTEKYTCPVCNEVFCNLGDFASHVNRHIKEEKKAKDIEEMLRKKQERERDEAQLKELYEAYRLSSQNYSTAQNNFNKKYGLTLIDIFYSFL